MAATSTKSVLFVCLGNICRSPIAEAVFRKMATDSGVADKWVIDSSATSDWNIGSSPDARALACLMKHGIETSHRARKRWRAPDGCSTWRALKASKVLKFDTDVCNTERDAIVVTKDDFMSFTYILCMDESNLSDLTKKAKTVNNCKAKIELLGSYDPQKQRIIRDPYNGSDEDFEKVYEQCVRCCKAFLEANS